MGAITPLVQRNRGMKYRLWAGFASGALTSAIVAGIVFGVIGTIVPGETSSLQFGALITLTGLLLIVASSHRLPLTVPQVHRQTRKSWGHRRPTGAATWMWGLDIGSGLTTFVHFGGYWLLPFAVVATGGVVYGTAVMGAFGLGRLLAYVAASRLLGRDVRSLPAGLARIHGEHATFALAHTVSLTAVTVSAALVALREVAS